MTSTATAAPATKVAALNPCACANYTVGGKTTGCPGTLTGKTFAPGHDAKLKGHLIRAGAAGLKVQTPNGEKTALEVANGYGFGHLVAAGIELGKAKLAAKAAKPKAGKVATAKEAATAPAKLVAEAAKAEKLPALAKKVRTVRTPRKPKTA